MARKAGVGRIGRQLRRRNAPRQRHSAEYVIRTQVIYTYGVDSANHDWSPQRHRTTPVEAAQRRVVTLRDDLEKNGSS